MRIFIKMILIVVTVMTMIFCYKFVILNDGIKTALSYSNLNYKEYDSHKKQEVIDDVHNIYTYQAFGRRFYIFETGIHGLLLESIGLNDTPSQSFIHQGLARVLDTLESNEIKVPHWGFFAGTALLIILFPSFKKLRKKT